MRDTLDLSSEWRCIVSVPDLIKHVNHSWCWCHIDLCHFGWNFIMLRVEINSVVCFVMYNFVLWMSILRYVFVWVFVMHIFVRMTIHILMGFCNVHLCTNDYPYYSFMVFRHVDLCTNDYPYSHGFSSCTSLYKWLSISLCMGFVMHSSVRMTIHFFWMDFLHVHFCTNDYHFFLNGFSSCTFLYGWLPSNFEWIFVIYISVRMTTFSF